MVRPLSNDARKSVARLRATIKSRGGEPIDAIDLKYLEPSFVDDLAIKAYGDPAKMNMLCKIGMHAWKRYPTPMIDPYPTYTKCRVCGKRKNWLWKDNDND